MDMASQLLERLTLPPEIVEVFFPSPQMKLRDFLAFKFQIGRSPTCHTVADEYFSPNPPTCLEFDPRTLLMPPKMVIKTILEAIRRTKAPDTIQSIACPHIPGNKLTYPCHLILYWAEMKSIGDIRSEWTSAVRGLENTRKFAKSSESHALATELLDNMMELPWDGILQGFNAGGRLFRLSAYCTDEWFASEHIDQMLELLENKIGHANLHARGICIEPSFHAQKIEAVYVYDHGDTYATAEGYRDLAEQGRDFSMGRKDILVTAFVHVAKNYSFTFQYNLLSNDPDVELVVPVTNDKQKPNISLPGKAKYSPAGLEDESKFNDPCSDYESDEESISESDSDTDEFSADESGASDSESNDAPNSHESKSGTMPSDSASAAGPSLVAEPLPPAPAPAPTDNKLKVVDAIACGLQDGEKKGLFRHWGRETEDQKKARLRRQAEDRERQAEIAVKIEQQKARNAAQRKENGRERERLKKQRQRKRKYEAEAKAGLLSAQTHGLQTVQLSDAALVGDLAEKSRPARRIIREFKENRDGHGSGSGYKTVDPDPNPENPDPNPREKKRKPQGRKKKSDHAPKKAQYVNWLTPFSWRSISIAGEMTRHPTTGLSVTAIVKFLKRLDPKTFSGLRTSTVDYWIDRKTADGARRWKAWVLEKTEKNGCTPGHDKGGRRGILTSYPEVVATVKTTLIRLREAGAQLNLVAAFSRCVVRNWNLSYECLSSPQIRARLREEREKKTDFWNELQSTEPEDHRPAEDATDLAEDKIPSPDLDEDDGVDDSDVRLMDVIADVLGEKRAKVEVKSTGGLASSALSESVDAEDPEDPTQAAEIFGVGKRKRRANKLYAGESWWRHDNASDDSDFEESVKKPMKKSRTKVSTTGSTGKQKASHKGQGNTNKR
ncbi:hypothetical protein GGX14DRAFT_398223 [Mycena pura]|uniref:Uncharacterized protein n=1 Tax=Mycena pura TaxID=153505 RepID=A0AAD6VAL0_9AGAR|nr:hypothetical protein GGX14DRAFT_398223 [Mycena pura]